MRRYSGRHGYSSSFLQTEVRSQRSRALDQLEDTTMLTLVTLDYRSQVHALVRLLATVALYMRRTRLAHSPAMLALRNRPSLLVNVLEWPICCQSC